MNEPTSQNLLHTVLGASGAVGKTVIKTLKTKQLPIRAVSRSLSMEGIEIVGADLLNPYEAKKVIMGSSHVYLCVGLPYKAAVWQKNWPLLMQNVIDACAATNATLIFLDNIYMYGPAPLAIPFDEQHPQRPSSQKGQTRKWTADMLLQAIKEEKIKAVIGRAADFYGPGAINSMFYNSFLERMLKGKAPLSLGKSNIKHTYADVSDVGRALVALALDPTTYGEVWHLPVGDPITIEAATAMFSQELGTNFKPGFLPGFMQKLLGLFISPIKEVGEMLYQFESEYVMSFEKFKKHFPDFKVTPYQKGFREMIEYFVSKKS